METNAKSSSVLKWVLIPILVFGCAKYWYLESNRVVNSKFLFGCIAS
jgi:hypothetical protein